MSLLENQKNERQQSVKELDEQRLSLLENVEELLDSHKKDFIVDSHLQRYAGELLPTELAFSIVAGSEQFTGIDELDMLELPHINIFTQLGSDDLEDTF